MPEVRFARTAAAALRGAGSAVFFAPESRLRKGWLRKAADGADWARLLAGVAKQAAAGPRGKLVSAQNPDAGPAALALGVLPDRVSRHNCPARSTMADDLMRRVEVRPGTTAVVLCVEKPAHALPLARAIGRALPEYTRATGNSGKATIRIACVRPDGSAHALSRLEQEIVRCGRWAARLYDMPTAEMSTTQFVSETRKAARGVAHLSVSVISGAKVLEKKMGGLHAVGRTAMHPPKLLLLRYKPPGAKRMGALVGKGIVYDTGGLSLKNSAGMYGMKGDMGGAAGVVGAALALAKAKHKDAFICAAALAENAIGPDAYRPGDILGMHSGKTVEINNTDAEGRLVVADGLSYVARTYKPDVVIDMATLTGAQLVATGHRHAAVVSNRAGLEALAVEAGRAGGDLTHPLPFAPEMYQAEFASKVADMRNSVADRMNAQTSCAAQFIYSHIEDLDLPWLHVDMAGPSGTSERGTGYGVALGAMLLHTMTEKALKA
ncbi:MAG: leucyl aminopeptidase family protein [Planctomycetota bacterium]|nr:leucyl aminopeptidase family protein [Planctomycetota bacterium]